MAQQQAKWVWVLGEIKG